jgi:hypothetical protein
LNHTWFCNLLTTIGEIGVTRSRGHPLRQKTGIKVEKEKKVADPIEATIDEASRQMIRRAQDLNIDTAFDRAVTLKPCNIGNQGTCCKNCGMGPCRVL